MIDLKGPEYAELRHVLAHLIYSIEAHLAGCPTTAQYELDSIKELVFWSDDSYEGIEADLRAKEGKREREGAQATGDGSCEPETVEGPCRARTGTPQDPDG